MKNNISSIRVAKIVFAIMYIVIGLSYMVEGADPSSRFYYFDNILVKVIGFFLIVASIGIFIRKEIARKGIVFLCIISIIELIITVDISIIDPFEMVIISFLAALIYMPGMIFFMNSKVKIYFTNKEEDILEESNEGNKEHSHLGVASFIVGIVNIAIATTVIVASMKYFPEVLEFGEEILEVQALAVALVIIYIANCISSLVGTIMGIVGILAKNKKKAFSIWGLALNLMILSMHLLIIIGITLEYKL